MKNEIYIAKNTTYTLNITGGEVDSLRIREDLKTTARAYNDGKVGIAGAIGLVDEVELLKRAEANLSQNVPYPCNLTAGERRAEDCRKEIIPRKDFVKKIQWLMARLNKEFPDYIFANKITLEEKETTYRNSECTEYFYAGNNFSIGFTVKAKSSANIVDFDYGVNQNYFDEEKIVSDLKNLIGAYDKVIDMPEEDLPIIVSQYIIQYPISEMIAESYVSGSSLLNGKLGQKIFDERINLCTDCAPGNLECTPFFDTEGTVPEEGGFHFIKNGVFSGLITYKRSAASFNLPLSGGARAEFDGVPSFGIATGLTLKNTTTSLKESVGGKAIYIAVTSGGDMTPDGTIGLPVMVAFLYENGKFLGRLPEFSVNGNVFDILGKDFIAVADNDVYSYMNEKVIAAKFKINR